MSQPVLHVKSSNFSRLYVEEKDLKGKLVDEYRTLCVVMVYQVRENGIRLGYAMVKTYFRY